ncbi:hypothetical protein P170DRAFT_426979 [Aspergillus steynii IBT 23096]|uniref:Uncharacterized protein n=1 Tax=Aspergillus steynii IBT 23096 TaxID=1392250 RepID=A0A2I2G4H9_9EURO|nr:uncharacterized protein P170DRAFT_426979 [Aspergillus steynii IBT 23096]PLB47763.1 hypothetical protein P170DRAFT_426979 [Aspergillus steynii IBT 23096]
MAQNNQIYQDLMRNNSEGRFLFNPAPFRKLRPGSLGYFDHTGTFIEITNILEPGRPQRDGFSAFRSPLATEPPRARDWKAKHSASVQSQHARVTGGLSAAGAGAPIDASAEVKNKREASGQAALITPCELVEERIDGPFTTVVKEWVLGNGKTLMGSVHREKIKTQGLWIVGVTYVTAECAMKLTAGSSREIDVGLDLAVTGIGKAGFGTGWSEKLDSENWEVHRATEEDQGLVVAFAGAKYEVRMFSGLKSTPLKETDITQTIAFPEPRVIRDENGNVTDVQLVDAQDIPSEESEFECECDMAGLSEDQIAAEKAYAKQQEDRKNVLKWELIEIAKMENGEEKRAVLNRLLGYDDAQYWLTMFE